MSKGSRSFRELCELGERLEATSSRNAMVALVADYLKTLSSGDLEVAVPLIVGKAFPDWDQRELEVSGATVVKVVEKLAGVSKGGFLEAFNRTGDYGGAVKLLFEEKRALKQAVLGASPLSLVEVYRGLEAIAEAKGPGSRRRKERVLEGLLSRADPLQAKYIVKAVLGERRHGFGEALMEEAVAKAFNVPLELVRRAYMLTSDLPLVAKTAAQGVKELSSLSVALFHPLRPMLAEKAESVAEALRELGGRCFMEFKLDGARLQVHKKGREVRVYSRRLTDVTESLPEVVEKVREGLAADEAVVEGEAVALGKEGRPKPFQYLMRRVRRLKEVEEGRLREPVEFYAFDVLYVNGRSLIDEPYLRRRRVLEEVVGLVRPIEAIEVSRVDEGEEVLRRAIEAGHEGVVAKDLEAPYTPGVRGRKWLKVKAGPHTLDLVIVAAEYGHGYRHRWLSDYHLAAYDPSTGGFEVIGKCFTGLTDEEIDYLTRRLRELAIAQRGRTVIVKPKVVVEVGFAELQESPHYKSGVALRFPRILRIREDKEPHEASTISEVREVFEKKFRAKAEA
ncbi:MAG: ATP-dependent DNA ligase [Candidatus Nezhaarchaeota archaeon]|nr:ATP-dependent DNA ligase [Candidatus Nezhaarchaeota archaeon]